MVTAYALLLALAVSSSHETVLLEFTAPWCGPCQAMEPTLRRLADAGFPIQKINVDQLPDAATRFGVTSVPCFVMLADGREVDRVVGAASFARLQQMFETAHVAPAGGRVRGQSPDGRSGRTGSADSAPRRQLPPDRLTSAASATPPPRQPTTDDIRTSVERALAATVRLKVDDGNGQSYGTGTIIDVHGAEALVVTCGHIFRDSQGKGPITVETFNAAAAHSGRLLSYDLERDIGLVSFAPRNSVTPARVASQGQAIRRGNTVFSIGCDRGSEPSVRQSRITAVDKYLGPPNIEVAGQPVVGRSGGGLFTMDGQLIGICNCADPTDDEGIYASLPTIHWELDRVGQRRIYQHTEQAQLLAGASNRAAAGERRPAPQSRPEMPRDMPITPVGLPPAPASGPADMEVICIVRSRSDPTGPNQVFVLHEPSNHLLQQLSGESGRSALSNLVPVDGRADPRSAVVRAQSRD